MQDLSPEKALELYSKASKAPYTFTTETLLDAALDRACENSILSFPGHIMNSLDSRALLRVVCILSLFALAKKQLQLIYYHPNQLEEQRKHMADMLTPVIEALSGTALTLPSGTKVLSRQVDASLRRLCSMQKHLMETIETKNNMPGKHELDSLRGHRSPESLFLMENSLPSALEEFELDIDSDTTEHPDLFID